MEVVKLEETETGERKHMASSTVGRKRGRPSKQQTEITNGLIDIFAAGIQSTVEDRINESSKEIIAKLTERVDAALLTIESTKEHTLVINDSVKGTFSNNHKRFKTLLAVVAQNLPLFISGGAGTGKTSACVDAAKALDLPFFTISVGAQTTKSDLFGFINANGEYMPSAFRTAYEKGGLFLLDEADAGNANVLVMLNAALSGHLCSFPDQMIERHENFRFVCTANTLGLGASLRYVGRNRLDAATLDRFVTLYWELDDAWEEGIASRYDHGSKWLRVIRKYRDMTDGSDIMISPRSTFKGAQLLDASIPVNEVLTMVFPSISEADRETLERYYK